MRFHTLAVFHRQGDLSADSHCTLPLSSVRFADLGLFNSLLQYVGFGCDTLIRACNRHGLISSRHTAG